MLFFILAQTETITEERDDLLDEIDATCHRLTKAKDELLASQTEYNQLRTQYRVQIESLTTHKYNLEESIAQQNNQIDSIRKELRKTEHLLGSEQENAKRLRNENDMLSQSIDKRRLELGVERSNLTKAADEIMQLREAVADDHISCEEKEAKHTEITKQTNNQMDELRQKLKETEQMLECEQKNVKCLHKENELLSKDIDARRLDLGLEQSNLTKAEDEVAQLQKAVSKAKISYKEKEAKHVEISKQKDKIIDELGRKLRETEQILESEQNNAKHLREEILRKSLDAKNLELAKEQAEKESTKLRKAFKAAEMSWKEKEAKQLEVIKRTNIHVDVLMQKLIETDQKFTSEQEKTKCLREENQRLTKSMDRRGLILNKTQSDLTNASDQIKRLRKLLEAAESSCTEKETKHVEIIKQKNTHLDELRQILRETEQKLETEL